jgi:hypothetical protein
VASDFPKWKHHKHNKSVLVHSPEQEQLLGDGWHDSLLEAKGPTTHSIHDSVKPASSESYAPSASGSDERLSELLEKLEGSSVHEQVAEQEETAEQEQPAEVEQERGVWRRKRKV